jgi:glucose/mannose-6-phosphate isomerase
VIDLDDPGSLAAADPHDALGIVERTPEQWSEAVTSARASRDQLPTRHGINGIVYCGMGGSGIAGDVLAAIAAETGTVAVTVVKGYKVPAWVGPNTLVLCASYSGNTEETLACFDDAAERKARVVALATGGALAERARAHNVALLSPVGELQPRQALASLTALTLVVAEQLSLIADLSASITEAGDFLERQVAVYGRDVPSANNDAKRIAGLLDGRVPLVWGQDGVLAVAAQRWRTQLNENAKVAAFSSALPELDHNEIVGYEKGSPGIADLAIVVLRMAGENPRVSRRIDATLERIGGMIGGSVEARAVGESPLARLMSAVLLGDFVSVYLAVRRGVDPTPVTAIEELKARLA